MEETPDSTQETSSRNPDIPKSDQADQIGDMLSMFSGGGASEGDEIDDLAKDPTGDLMGDAQKPERSFSELEELQKGGEEKKEQTTAEEVEELTEARGEEVSEAKEEEKETPKAEEGDDDRIARMMQVVEEQAARIEELSKKKEEPKVKEEPVEEAKVPEVRPVQIGDLATDEEIEAAREDPAKFKELLARTAVAARESILRDIPQLVSSAVARQASAHTEVEKFWEENKDLKPITKYVTQVADTVASENPEWDTSRVLAETAKRSREALGLTKAALEKEQERREEEEEVKSKDPAFATPPRGGGNRSTREVKRTEQQQQIDDLVASVEPQL